MPVAHAQTHEWSYLGGATGFSYQDGLLAWVVDGKIGVLRVNNPYQLIASPYLLGPATVQGSPVLTSIADGPSGEERRYAFANGLSGFLMKLDVSASEEFPGQALQVATTAGVAQLRDMRRAACPTDNLVATPVVQRRADSNAQFTLDQDIVIVATAHGCGDTTSNQVIALDAVDVTRPPLWVFNSGEYEIGPIQSCLLDLDRNRVHCGALQPTATFQPGVISVDTNTGTLAWASIFDSGVQARATLGAPGSDLADRLYVGDLRGRVHALDAEDGSELVSAVTPGGLVDPSIERDLAVGSGVYAGYVLAVSRGGVLRAFFDAGTELFELWQTSFAGGQHVISQPVPISSLGKLFVATSDARLHQLALASGSDEASAYLSQGGIPPTRGFATMTDYLPSEGPPFRIVGSIIDVANSSWPGSVIRAYRVPCQPAMSDCIYAGDGGSPDLTPPDVVPTINGSLGKAGWYVSDVQIVWSVTDLESEILDASGCQATTIAADTNGVTLTCTATSTGGTSSEAVTVMRDATAPSVSVAVPADGATYPRNAVVIASFACADSLSGIATCAGSVPNGQAIDTSAKKKNARFDVKATDSAGNKVTRVVRYSVR